MLAASITTSTLEHSQTSRPWFLPSCPFLRPSEEPGQPVAQAAELAVASCEHPDQLRTRLVEGGASGSGEKRRHFSTVLLKGVGKLFESHLSRVALPVLRPHPAVA